MESNEEWKKANKILKLRSVDTDIQVLSDKLQDLENMLLQEKFDATINIAWFKYMNI